ncbi:transglycosylase [Polynucleobacter sp. SHI8]|uniref:lytic transglycosylase domain-containing protein n=1 Tax=unclassified Polynucleobacter TaxID=2640945 RepID=UPI0024933F7E|nr:MULTISPECIES: lytic transglycosylase domain-containing protein [unclassified Polynucleobacter]BDW12210.1 transglycosylase [Polynucleobacter sp. SHI2]BDW14658.1 transglycosylase [Polynucleobacter sp. SHI8]
MNLLRISTLIISLLFSISLCAATKNTFKSSSSNQASQSTKKVEGLSEQDKKFIELREAARKNDLLKASQLANQLSDYEIPDYVEYFKIKPRLYDSAAKSNAATDADSEVNNFLKKYKGSGLADRMRNDWLLVLGKRKDWANFDIEYPQFALDDDTQVKCYAMMSKLAKGEPPKNVGAQAKATLLDPRYFGDACPELVSQLYARGGLSKQESQGISRSATEMNFDSLGQRMGVDDPIAGIVKKARTNPNLAMKTFDENDWKNNTEYKGMAWGVIGQFLAKKLDPTAIDAYRKQHALGNSELLSPESSEWKIRAALREKDWRLVKESVETMPEAVRARDPAWTYWYGKALKELGDERANEQFEKLANQFNFYGQLSLEELGRPIQVPPKTVITDADMKSISKSIPAFNKAAKLYDMNLRTEGNREWNWELRGMSDKELLASAEYGKKINMLDRTVNTSDRTKQEHNFSLRYPTPYIDKLNPITKQIQLDVNWVYGLIRQESRFVTAARSHVGASGLMQVMPATGQFVAKKIGMSDYTPDKLSELQTNLVLGSNYLNMVLNDLDGSWGLASAAYNAGPGRPKQWRQTLTKPVSMEIFAETIPFTETRTYVKNVLSNAVYYEILSTGKPQSLKAKLGTVNPSQVINSNLP